MTAKKTVKNDVTLSGIGIHSGKPVQLKLMPSDSGEIIFNRADLGNLKFRLDPMNVQADNCTMLVTDKGRIQTLEHLLAVLWVFGIDSVTIELDQEEIPVMDGSALHFVRAIRTAGMRDIAQEKNPVKIAQPFKIDDEDASISVEPHKGLKITYHIDYEHPSIKKQSLSIILNPENFAAEIAPARTFGFFKDVPNLLKRGLARGGSLENAVVLDNSKVISGPLRFPDEFVRHKILDFIGDLSLLKNPVSGHFIAKKAGHEFHLKVVRFLLNNPAYLSADS